MSHNAIRHVDKAKRHVDNAARHVDNTTCHVGNSTHCATLPSLLSVSCCPQMSILSKLTVAEIKWLTLLYYQTYIKMNFNVAKQLLSLINLFGMVFETRTSLKITAPNPYEMFITPHKTVEITQC